MATDSSDDKNKYSKRIDEIIEDAEIEAELEAEKKIRVKKTKTALTALIGIVLSIGAYYAFTQKMNESADEKLPLAKVSPLPEPKPIPFPLDNKDNPLPEIQENATKEAPLTVPAPPVEPKASVKPEDSKPKEMETAKKAKPAPEPAPAKISKPKEHITDKKIEGKPITDVAHQTKQPVKTIETDRHNKTEKKPSHLSAKQQLDELTDSQPTKEALKSPPKPKPQATPHEEPKTPKTEKPLPVTEKKAEVKLPKTVATNGQKEFFIQLGVFTLKNNADHLTSELLAKGFNPTVSVQPGSPFHKILAGEFPDKKSSDPLFKELKEAGFHPQHEKNPNNTHSLLLGKFISKKEADALHKKLKLKGFQPNETTTHTETYVVKITGFETSEDALSARKKLEQAGYKNSIIKEIG